MKKQYRCWAEVDLEALRGNLAWIRRRVGPKVKLLTVVKADAYGHGLKQIAALLMQSGTDIFGVANLQEAHAIRSVGHGWPILMLGACLPEEIERAVRDDVCPTLSSLEEAQAFSQAAMHLQRTVSAHVKIDTGMGRLGMDAESAVECIEAMRRLPGLRLEGIYTHYASAEEDAAFSRRQARRFAQVLADLGERGITFPLVHANNSAAVLHQPGTTGNLIRPGLLVYGILPAGRRRWARGDAAQLQPALVLKSRVSLVKTVPRGTRLSYGGTYRAKRSVRVATVTAGYGDGYLRAAGGKGCVLIRGCRCSILGRITMDQMLVDANDAGPVVAGEEVVLIGSQGTESITASEVATWAGTIPWEVLTAITYRVPRVYRGSQAA
jgi:alanine racemase